MLASAMKWITGIDFKWVLIGVVALSAVSVVFAGYRHVENLTNNLAKAKAELASEVIKRKTAEATRDEVKRQHDADVGRMQDLEAERSQLETDIADLNDQINQLNTEKDIANDPAKAAADFVRESDRLNGVLDSLSAGRAARNRAAPAR